MPIREMCYQTFHSLTTHSVQRSSMARILTWESLLIAAAQVLSVAGIVSRFMSNFGWVTSGTLMSVLREFAVVDPY